MKEKGIIKSRDKRNENIRNTAAIFENMNGENREKER